MLKKANMILVIMASVLTILLNVGFLFYIPVVFFYLLKDYRNIIAFEKKINISNVRTSFFNPLKILYSKNGKRGCISPRCVKLNEKVVANEYSNYKKQMDYIHYLKLIITELYKNK